MTPLLDFYFLALSLFSTWRSIFNAHHVLISPFRQQSPTTPCLPEIISLNSYQRRSATIATMEEVTVPGPSEPPPLPYSLHTRKKSIAIFWTIFVVDTLAQPLILYWCLWYLTDLSHNLGTIYGWNKYQIGSLTFRSVLHRHRITWRCLRLRILLPPS